MVKTLQERALLDKNFFTTEFLQICKEEDLSIIIIAKEWKKKKLSVYCIKPPLLFPKQDRDSTKMKTIGLFLWQECSYPQKNSKLNSARHEEENNTP